MTKLKATEIIANEFLEKILDKNVMPWELTWNLTFPKSVQTNKYYHGSYNKFRLSYEKDIMKYNSNFWGTFKSWEKLNRSIKKGNKGTVVKFTSITRMKNNKKISEKTYKSLDKNERKDVKKIFTNRFYKVFNLDQTSGTNLDGKFVEEKKEKLSITEIDNIINSIKNKPRILHGFNIASYLNIKHEIHMPDQKQFIENAKEKYDNESLGIPFYYDTLLHEIIHATGHKDSLNRNMDNNNKKAYAKEELIAEIGKNMLMNKFNINTNETDKNNTSYIKNWVTAYNIIKNKDRKDKIDLLKENKDILIQACANAMKAIEFILDNKKEGCKQAM